ncbi:MAG: c-type cytochrome, partial [Planctomycetales bacterium]|nr:c-type cytochrome [Planctomycetales bacterium]
IGCQPSGVRADTLRNAKPLEQLLTATDKSFLAQQVRLRGDARRGALVFYTSAAACVNCHGSGDNASPLGPDLAKLGDVTDEHVIESLLDPSKKIREGYQTNNILMDDGTVVSGLIAEQTDEMIAIRSASDLTRRQTFARDEIVEIKPTTKSMMPDGLAASLGDQRDFFDLARYVMEVAAGGPDRAASLKPSADQLNVKDDSVDLDHAGIIGGLRSRDFDAGKAIYHGYCFNCHGNDGNTPSLPTARAFGTQKLRFGNDPYRMFMTLTRGNGLMAPMSHLTPKERYQVVHYIREQFMKPTNPDYFKVDKEYLATLPKGDKDGTEIENVTRDFGPALASQLERKFSSVLTVKVGSITVSYDLHTMNQAAIWRDGFLDLSNTQHVRGRGEGTAIPDGQAIVGLQGWQWGHDETLDYSRDNLLPRGPMPKSWMDYHGHHLHGDKLTLRYSIDGRDISEFPVPGPQPDSIRHSLQIGPGRSLVLAAATGDQAWRRRIILKSDGTQTEGNSGDAEHTFAMVGDDSSGQLGEFSFVAVNGDVTGMRWTIDPQNRLQLIIPADDAVRQFDVHCMTGRGDDALKLCLRSIEQSRSAPDRVDFDQLTGGGPLLWPDVLTTIGYPGLQQGAYVLDTITIPESTPWNTWFRTSALDFFPDGRMAVATHGGDIWIVSGIDNDLLNLRWKRFAGGLYEPFGIKIVDGHIYVTCKDRLTKLHDKDENGEADFYESFSADQDVSVNFHAFNFDLQTDNEGNFYYAKSGHGTDSDIPGAVIKVSSDGLQRQVYCTGFRTPNGMGSLPDGRVTASDNQGQWTPASKISVLKQGGFYGWVGNYSIPGMWAPGGGTIDLDKVVAPETFDQPLVWMPQEFDNSCGGEVWVDDDRWGPLSGRMLHTSFGKGWMYYMMIQDFPDVSQAAIVKLPFDFSTGIMRARVNPADGQVYATGLQGWNGGGRVGLLDKGIQRLRYTGKPYKMLSDCKVERGGLRLKFNFPLEIRSATDIASYDVKEWNYRRQKSYGSDMYSPSTGEKGIDEMKITSISLGVDGRSVILNVPDLHPVNQVHILLKIKTQDGEDFEEEIYWTINRVDD